MHYLLTHICFAGIVFTFVQILIGLKTFVARYLYEK